MFQLEESKYLYLLLIVPILVVFFVFNFYWKTQDPRMMKILSMMESVEPWVVDDVEIAK